MAIKFVHIIMAVTVVMMLAYLMCAEVNRCFFSAGGRGNITASTGTSTLPTIVILGPKGEDSRLHATVPMMAPSSFPSIQAQQQSKTEPNATKRQFTTTLIVGGVLAGFVLFIAFFIYLMCWMKMISSRVRASVGENEREITKNTTPTPAGTGRTQVLGGLSIAPNHIEELIAQTRAATGAGENDTIIIIDELMD